MRETLSQRRIGAAAALVAALAGLAAAIVGLGGGGAALERPARAAVAAADPSPPFVFVENRGQADARVRYLAEGSGYAFAFTPEEVVLSLAKGGTPQAPRATLALRFVRANPHAVPEGQERTNARVSYLRGDDPARWQTNLPAYAEVLYRGLWPGVDLVLRGRDGELKYEFHVGPGARVEDIRLAYAGARGLELDAAGALLVRTPLGKLRDAPPVAFQEVAGDRVSVGARYVLGGRVDGAPAYGFAVGAAYRPDRKLVIDPGLDYSTFVGGSSHERADGVAVDGAGNAYLVGTTQSSDLPTTPGAFDRTFAGGVVDVFVAKLAPDGSLAYATYLGGTPTPLERGTGDPYEFGRGIAVDAEGHAYVTGQTTSSDFPTTSGAFDRTINASARNATDGFVTKLNPTGSGLVYSTFLGGTDPDDPDAIAVDAAGNAYVTGLTVSGDFPTTPGAAQPTNGGGQDAFVAKLDAAGSALVYSTYLGGADNEIGNGVAVDSGGNAYVAGGTRSSDFPTTPGAFDPTHQGGEFAELFDAFVSKLDPRGSLAYSTFLGGSEIDRATDVEVDGGGNAYVAGSTLSPEFPVTPGAFDSAFAAGGEGFVTKLSGDGSSLVYSTFTAGAGPAGIAVDPATKVWIAGGAGPDAPTTADAFDAAHSGGNDVWLGRLGPDGSTLEYATFLGGSNSETPSDVALDDAGNVYVAGTTYSPDFPTTAGAFDRVFDGDPSIFWGDAFAARLGFGGGTGETEPAPAERTTTSFSGEIDKNRTVARTVSIGKGSVDLALDWTESRANLTLRVRDPGGNVVFSDAGSAKPKRGSFSAAVAGDYRFEVANATDRKTRYTLSITHPVAGSPSVALTSLALTPTSVAGGTSATGTVTLSAGAPAGGASVALASGNTTVATVPPSVTVPAGAVSASFTVSTASVSADASAVISAAYGGATRTATLAVTATGVALSSLVLDPRSVTGGNSSAGTVTLSAAAPAGGASVALASSNTDTATVPASVTVPAGATTASFTVSTANVSFDSSSSISASYGGVTHHVILSVTAASASDTVSISRAEYDSGKRELRVEASSSSSSATLQAYVSATGELIGTLSGGRGEFSWPANPENITVRSSLGGSATRAVTLK